MIHNHEVPGSIPGPATTREVNDLSFSFPPRDPGLNRGPLVLFLVRYSERGGLRPLSLAYSLRPNTYIHAYG